MDGSTISSACGGLFIDTSAESQEAEKTVRPNMENQNDSFHTVKYKGKKTVDKRGRDTESEGKQQEKKARKQDEFVVYVKGTKTNLTKKNPKTVQSDIINEFGNVQKVQMAGDSLRISCVNDSQKSHVLNEKFLGLEPIIVTLPFAEQTSERRTFKRGVLYNVGEEIDLNEFLGENEPNGLVKVRRVNAHAEGTEYPTKTVIAEFCEDIERPDYLTFGWREFPVHDYIPRPLRCFKCQMFGHTAGRCKNAVPRCPRCAGQHSFEHCNSNFLKCRNCGGEHSAAYKGCPKYGWVKDSLKEAVHQNRPYSEVLKSNRPELAKRIESAKNNITTRSHNRPGDSTTQVYTQGRLPKIARPLSTSSTSTPMVASVLSQHLPPAVSPIPATPPRLTGAKGPKVSSLPTPVRPSTSNKPSLRTTQTPVRRINNDSNSQNATGAITITIDKLIALIFHLLNNADIQPTVDNVKNSLESALQFLGVTCQFCPITNK